MIWLATHRSTIGCDRALFALIQEGLVARRSEAFVERRFRALSLPCRIPWLDQPQRLDARQLQNELFEAWDELGNVPIKDLGSSQARRRLLARPMRFELPGAESRLLQIPPESSARVGQILQFPISELAAAIATALGRASVRIASHRPLVAGSAMHQMWRLIQGGRAAGPAERATDSERGSVVPRRSNYYGS